MVYLLSADYFEYGNEYFALHNVGLNDAVEWLALHLRVPRIPVSKLEPETGYPHCFCGTPQSLQQMLG
jgi:hypothetical protein